MDQNTLETSLQTHVESALEGRSNQGNDIAGLLNERSGIFFDRCPCMYNGVWGTAALRDLPSALARLATSPEPSANPAALAREARSAITEALQHIMSTYENIGAHPISASMQGGLLGALLAELEEGTASSRTT